MHTITEVDLRQWCKDAGYSGEDNPPAMKSWLETQYDAIEINGNQVALKDCQIEQPKKVLPATKTETPTEDFDAKLKAAVDAALKAKGIEPDVKRPRLVTPDTAKVSNVKSVEQALYEREIEKGNARFKSYEAAKGFQLWMQGNIHKATNSFDAYAKSTKAFAEFTEKVWGKAYAGNSQANGAALVPEQFIPDLIRNVEEYGVARRLAKVVPMAAETVILPRRTGGLTMYYVAQNGTATASTGTYDNVTLTARTGIVYCTASMQMLQDSGLPFTDLLMEEMAYSIAIAEDDAVLKGDGSGTYGGMTGFERKYGVTATDGGYVVVGGADATAHTAAQLNTAIGRLPSYARKNAVWCVHPTIKANVFDRLADSTPGGLTLGELTGFGLVQKWKGIPIIENQSMSSVLDANATNRAGFTAGDQIDILLGDFSRAALFGERMQVQLETDMSVGFASYSIAFRGVVRHDVNVHSVGSSTAAGPVISFWQT
jgi:HK97 family phage major capsid protein